MAEWFRVDRRASKWHKLRQRLPGEHATVLQGVCGNGLGDSPEREPRALVTQVEPRRERICARCLRVGERVGNG